MDNRYLYRAWIKEYQMMVDVMRLNYDGSIEAQLAEDDDPSEFEACEIELVQCTGLTAVKSYRGADPEDLLIYEGDICIDSLGWVFEVTWDNDNARFIGCHSKPRGDTYVCYVSKQPKVEIIGTVYDNPEPLEVDGE